MKSRKHLFSALLFICAVLAYVLYPTDENRIRKTLTNAGESVASEDIDGVMKFISFNYADDFGNNYLMLRKTLQSVFKRLDGIDIEKSIIKISVGDKKAESELSVRVAASASLGSQGNETDKGYIIGDAVDAAKIKVYFEKSLNKWLINRVEGLDKAVRY